MSLRVISDRVHLMPQCLLPGDRSRHSRALPFRLRAVLYSFQPAATGIRLPGGWPPKGPSGSSGQQLGVNVSEATIKSAGNLKLVGCNVAEHETCFDVLSPSVANVGGCLADGHFFNEKAAFGANGFNVLLKASGETQSGVEGFGVEDALEHLIVSGGVSP